MTDTSFLQFSSPFIDPKTGVLQRWAHQYLLNPTVSNINVAVGGTFNAPGATVVAKSVQLGIPVRPSSGGTGISTGTSGGILGFTSATTLASSALLGSSQIVLGGGAGATPSTPLGLGSAHVVLHGNAAGAPTWSAVDLASDVTGSLPTSSLSGTISLTSQVTGVLPVANGGTNANAPGATAANNIGALAIASNLSDLNSAGTARTNLGLGTLATLSTVTLTTNVTGVLPVANGGTNANAAGATACANIGALAVANNLSDVTAATARTNLGLGTMATQNANAVAITGSTINGTVIGGVTPAAGSFTTATVTPVSGNALTVTQVAGGNGVVVNTVNALTPFYVASSAGVQTNIFECAQTGQTHWICYQPASSNDLRFYNGGDRLVLTSAGVLQASGSALIKNVTQLFTGVAGHKTSDSTAANNTLTADTDLTLTFNETGNYRLEGTLFFYEVTLGTGGFQFDFNSGTATLTIIYGVAGFNTSNFSQAAVTSAATATSFATIPTSSSAPAWVEINGYLNVTGAGTLALRWAQASTLGADLTHLMAGSMLIATKIG